ncbi:hypothetical protein B0H12DRAFT_465823 [Mycena haematopus]|nr:hypothetical protein B0H12DRAFT_465823 [Mycena haematopus]
MNILAFISKPPPAMGYSSRWDQTDKGNRPKSRRRITERPPSVHEKYSTHGDSHYRDNGHSARHHDSASRSNSSRHPDAHRHEPDQSLERPDVRRARRDLSAESESRHSVRQSSSLCLVTLSNSISR